MSWPQQGKKTEREGTLLQLVFVLVAQGSPVIGGSLNGVFCSTAVWLLYSCTTVAEFLQ